MDFKKDSVEISLYLSGKGIDERFCKVFEGERPLLMLTAYIHVFTVESVLFRL